MAEPLLLLKDVKCEFPVEKGVFKPKRSIRAVNGINFEIKHGETFGLVGESGSGKSTIAKIVTGLQTVSSGQVIFEGEDITPQTHHAKALKLREIQMVFQDPYASLDPRMSIGSIIEEPMLINGWDKDRRKKQCARLLELVGLSKEVATRFPHELSGGQRQRVAITRAIVLQPKLVICDESVSALDVSVQAQILNLLDDLQHEFNLTYLFIAHNLGVVRHMSDRIGIMYLGKIVETGITEDIYQTPLHPYTQALVSVIPSHEHQMRSERIILKGEIPSPLKIPKGCNFHTRCPYKKNICEQIEPSLIEVDPNRFVSCHLYHPGNVRESVTD